MRLWLAIRVFFAILFQGSVAERIRVALDSTASTEAEPKPVPARAPQPQLPKQPQRSDALTLLAALQREARFVDLTQETLDQYTDQQVGAAARDVLRDCRAVLDRLFALRPVVAAEEDSRVEVPRGFDQGRYRMTGDVAGDPPFHGRLVHHGWEASRCDLPVWSGSSQAARIIAPVEVEL